MSYGSTRIPWLSIVVALKNPSLDEDSFGDEYMQRIFCSVGVIAVLFFGACDSNKKLSQDNAEKAIKAVASTHTGTHFGMSDPDCGYGRQMGREKCFNVQSIATINPLSQFSETEATSLVTFKCKDTFALKFMFQKDIDNRWFLTKLGFVEGSDDSCGQVREMIQNNQNLKVLAQ